MICPICHNEFNPEPGLNTKQHLARDRTIIERIMMKYEQCRQDDIITREI